MSISKRRLQRNKSRWIIKNIIAHKQNYRCCYCDLHMSEDQMSLEHLKPQAEGGKDDIDNLAVAHGACNNIRPNAVNWLDWKSLLLNELSYTGFLTIYQDHLHGSILKNIYKLYMQLHNKKGLKNKEVYNF